MLCFPCYAVQVDHTNLIARAQGGDEAAFEELYRACYAPVYRFVLTRIKSHDEAEDITQEVFVKLLNTLARYEKRSPSLLPYLFVIARNAIIDQYRKRRPEAPEEELWELASADPTPEEAAILGEETAQVIALVNQLKESDAAVVRMKYFDGLSTAEIALVVEKSEEAVRQILSRSVAQLRSLYTSLRSP